MSHTALSTSSCFYLYLPQWQSLHPFFDNFKHSNCHLNLPPLWVRLALPQCPSFLSFFLSFSLPSSFPTPLPPSFLSFFFPLISFLLPCQLFPMFFSLAQLEQYLERGFLHVSVYHSCKYCVSNQIKEPKTTLANATKVLFKSLC